MPAPWSARLCDGACLVFALWTVLCSIVVATEGSLRLLVCLFGLGITGASIVAYRFRHAASWSPDPSARVTEVGRLQVAGLVVGLVAGALVLGLWKREGMILLWWCAVAWLAVATTAVFRSSSPAVCQARASRSHELGLLAVVVLCVLVTLVTHRPDTDDAFYVNLAVAAADSPGNTLLASDTLHGIVGVPLLSPVYLVHSYELANGALSYLTGIPAILCFHWISASIAAAFLVLAAARLFRLLTPDTWLWSVVTFVIVLLCLGDSHQSYGNFAFVRMWQGKAILLFVFVPLVYAYAMEFALRPTGWGWWKLSAAQIAAVGCSSTALWLAPAGAFVALACALRPNAHGLVTLARGALSSAYVLVVGWLLRSELHDLATRLMASWEPGVRLGSALSTVLGNEGLLAFASSTALMAWACCRRALARRFALAFSLSALLVFLNPYTDHWIRANVTGPYYWRSLWSLPVPALMTLVLLAPVNLARERLRPLALLVSFALVLVFALVIAKHGTLSGANGGAEGEALRIGLPSVKAPDIPYRWAEIVNDSVPPGSPVVAPPYISNWIPTFHHPAAPLQVRADYLYDAESRERVPHAALRNWMTCFVEGDPPGDELAAKRFELGLEQLGVKAVCLRRSTNSQLAAPILRNAGFRRARENKLFLLWVRS